MTAQSAMTLGIPDKKNGPRQNFLCLIKGNEISACTTVPALLAQSDPQHLRPTGHADCT